MACRLRLLDGRATLADVLKRAGYPSPVHALAKYTSFLHPDTVAQTAGRPLFRVVRGPAGERGSLKTDTDGRLTMLDDNTAPTHAFLWAADRSRSDDLQFNHIWALSDDVRYYTALWNICVTPAFLAKLTDVEEQAKAVLSRRAFDLYGRMPDGVAAPDVPEGYEELEWALSPPAVMDLEGLLRDRLRGSNKSRTTKSARECGWLFSDFEPDLTP